MSTWDRAMYVARCYAISSRVRWSVLGHCQAGKWCYHAWRNDRPLTVDERTTIPRERR